MVSQGLPSHGDGGWHHVPGHAPQDGVKKGGKPSSSGQLCAETTGEGEPGTFSSSPLKVFMFYSLLQMGFNKTNTDWLRCLGCNGMVTEDTVLLTLWAGFHHGQNAQNSPHRQCCARALCDLPLELCVV